jgi:bifunctional UDP-N-acetylglucosamine pyrophosphorylase/glucosamine-1-phosphate N-acetyltransferase
MLESVKAVVLAAGKSTRMKSEKSKVVHRILGKEIINYLLDALIEVGVAAKDIVVVIGQNQEEVVAAIRYPVCYAKQEEQLGTAHALLSAAPLLKGFCDTLLVLVGDNPYVTAAEIKKLIQAHYQANYGCTFISAIFPDKPPAYGRVIRDQQGSVLAVVEESEATPDQLLIREVNSSLYAFANAIAFPLLQQINNNNAKKEYYLTDIIGIMKKYGHAVQAVVADDHRLAIGINSRWELQEAQKYFNQENLRHLALHAGVTILASDSVTVENGVEVGRDTVIYPYTYIAAGTRIGKNCQIGPLAYLQGVTIPDNQVIACTQLKQT